MAIKKLIIFLLCISLFFVSIPGFAEEQQDLDNQNELYEQQELTEQDEQRRSHRIFQRFAWSGGEFALRYEVVFERIVDDDYVPHLIEFTVSQFIEVSLSVGRYRFRVIPYDVLNKPSEPSEWRYIELLPVPVSETETEIVSEPEQKIEQETQVQPRESARQGARERAQAEHDEEVDSLKTLILTAGGAISPLVPMYGTAFSDSATFLGITARASAVYQTPFNLYIGPEVVVSFCASKKSVLTAGINVLTMKWLPGDIYGFGFKLGAAYPIMPSDMSGLMSNIGASFHWRFIKNVILETGFDFNGISQDRQSGSFRPWIGASYQFN